MAMITSKHRCIIQGFNDSSTQFGIFTELGFLNSVGLFFAESIDFFAIQRQIPNPFMSLLVKTASKIGFCLE